MSKPLLHRFLLAALLLLAAPAPGHAELEQIPGPHSPTTKEQVRVYRPIDDQLVGRVSIPDPKAAVLVQPEGRDWREFRNVTSRAVAGVLMVGIVLVLAVFYLKHGVIRIEAGRSGRTIVRFTGIERFAHWLTGVSFLTLALTGLVVLFGRPLLIPIIGQTAFAAFAHWSKTAHNFISFAFVTGLLLMLVLWVRDNIPERADWAWLRCAGGLFSGANHPEAGKFNAGQKILYWFILLTGIAMAVTGYLLMFPFYLNGISGMQLAHIVHALLGGVMISAIIGHIYIGTLGMEGAFDAMGSGRVDENWAREHHSRWYQRERARERGTAGAD